MLSKTIASQLIAAALCVGVTSASHVCAADFSGIGYLTPDDNNSSAMSLSRDGSTIAGLSWRDFSFEFPDGPQNYRTYQRAFIQTASGTRSLEVPPYQNYFGYDSIYDIAPGGSAVFADHTSYAESFFGQTFGTYSQSGQEVWTPNEGFTPIEEGLYPAAFGGSKEIYAGTTRRFVSFESPPSHAYRHTPEAGNQDLGWIRPTLGPAYPQSTTGKATGISVDGNVVVGTNSDRRSNIIVIGVPNSDPSDLYFGEEAFRWTPATGMVPLGYLPGTTSSRANGVSGDGKIVFGSAGRSGEILSPVGVGPTAFRWTEATGMVAINSPSESQTVTLNAANFDGSILVGSSNPALTLFIDPSTGFVQRSSGFASAVIWDQSHGLRDLETVLETEYGMDLTEWQLLSANDISDDGRTIIGSGINPEGNVEGWIVHLGPVAVPEPAAWALFAIGACTAPILRRKGQKR
jgi:hypothetical protein